MKINPISFGKAIMVVGKNPSQTASDVVNITYEKKWQNTKEGKFARSIFNDVTCNEERPRHWKIAGNHYIFSGREAVLADEIEKDMHKEKEAIREEYKTGKIKCKQMFEEEEKLLEKYSEKLLNLVDDNCGMEGVMVKNYYPYKDTLSAIRYVEFKKGQIKTKSCDIN